MSEFTQEELNTLINSVYCGIEIGLIPENKPYPELKSATKTNSEINDSEFRLQYIKSDKPFMDKFVIDDLVGNNHIFGYFGLTDNHSMIIREAKKFLLRKRLGGVTRA